MILRVKIDGDELIILKDVKRWSWEAGAHYLEVTGAGRRWRIRGNRVDWVEAIKDGESESYRSVTDQQPDKIDLLGYLCRTGKHDECKNTDCSCAHHTMAK